MNNSVQKWKNLFFIGFFLIFLLGCQPQKTFSENEIMIIPQVQTMILGKGSFLFAENTKIIVQNTEQQAIAKQFSDLFEKSARWKLQIAFSDREKDNQMFFKTDTSLDDEEYTLDISTRRIEIKAGKPAGFFYALQTLRQLLPAEIESSQKHEKINWIVPVISISDSPAFKWRGYMLDVSRHFFQKEEVLQLIDWLALHKINVLHLHLVDDQGWRIEIKKYQKLTSVGAWRADRENFPWDKRLPQMPGEKATYGGFYTQEDIKEMVKYAESRYITIVPEIEMPAHVSSALASYPEYSCEGAPLTVPVGEVWPITDIYCVGNDAVFTFLQDILGEVIELFPSKYIHIGGDEATKTSWENCLKCQERMKTEGLKNTDELQSYFIKRIEKFLNAKGRTLIGWDEILEGGLPQNAVVMSWRGMEGGITASKQGHDVIMTPVDPCYLDSGQESLKKIYEFNPVPKELDAESAQHILGAQANLWTEHIATWKHIQYMTFPRIAALSESLWSKREVKNWNDFYHRLRLFTKRYDELGINYAKSAFKNRFNNTGTEKTFD